MGKITYEQAFSDWSYLWHEYGPANDMTGGYVDQHDLERLLKDPSKTTARSCLEDQIHYWFQVGPDTPPRVPSSDDERLQEIADRYGEEIP